MASECHKTILAALNASNAALSIVGNNPASKLEKACVREYGFVCLLVFQQVLLLGSAPPKQHLENMKRAISLLEIISDEPGIVELISVLQKNVG